MRILHLSTTSDHGGATRATLRVHQGLRALGHESHVLALRGRAGSDAALFVPGGETRAKLARLWRRHISHAGVRQPVLRPEFITEAFTDSRSPYPHEDFLRRWPADLIHLHWTSGFVDLPSLFAGHLGRVPIVWTLHDMRGFTGGCHYNQGCENFTRSCGRCPQLAQSGENDSSRQDWGRMAAFRDAWRSQPFAVATNSRWLEAEARRSSLLRNVSVETVHYGLDLQEFSPLDRAEARRSLGLSIDARCVLFAADHFGVRRKGLHLLVEALGRVRDGQIVTVLSLGHGGIPAEIAEGLHFGYVNDPRLLRLVYNAADLFIMPSLQEAFGQTALEAIACGTPVVAFAEGGLPEVVQPGVSGFLAPSGDAAALADAIARALGNPSALAALRPSCRHLAESHFALERQARDYVRIYERLRQHST